LKGWEGWEGFAVGPCERQGPLYLPLAGAVHAPRIALPSAHGKAQRGATMALVEASRHASQGTR
jgi:predicted small lipoprotein YifL